jgi:hypothetical protein
MLTIKHFWSNLFANIQIHCPNCQSYIEIHADKLDCAFECLCSYRWSQITADAIENHFADCGGCSMINWGLRFVSRIGSFRNNLLPVCGWSVGCLKINWASISFFQVMAINGYCMNIPLVGRHSQVMQGLSGFSGKLTRGRHTGL